MFCPNCGAKALPGQKFCMSCGFKFPLEEESAPEAPVTPEVVEAGEPEVVEAVETPAIPEPVEVAETVAIPEPVEPAPIPEPVEAASITEPVTPATDIPTSSIEAAETALFEAAEAAKREVRGSAPDGSGVVVERIDLSSINAPKGASSAAPASDETLFAPEPATTVIPQAEPARGVPIPQPVAPVPPQPVEATMAQPIPQPVSEPAPLSGSSSSGTQGSYAEPPASAYTPQVVPQATTKKAWYSSPIVPVIAGLAAFAAASSIAFRAASGLFSSGGSHNVPSPIEEVKVDDDDDSLSDIFEQIESESSSVDSNPAPSYVGSESDYLESHGYPTLLAFMELSGKDLASLVTSNDYFFYSEGENNVYAKHDGTIVFNVLTDEGYLEEDDYDDLSAGGKDEGAIYICVLEGFNSPDAVLDGMANCVISDRKAVSDKETIAAIYGPSMREYLVDIYDVEDGDYEIDLYSPEAIEFGFFDTVNDGEFGSTASEIVKNFNG